MPNIKSQKDRVVQAKKEAMHNKAIKTSLKTWSIGSILVPIVGSIILIIASIFIH